MSYFLFYIVDYILWYRVFISCLLLFSRHFSCLTSASSALQSFSLLTDDSLLSCSLSLSLSPHEHHPPVSLGSFSVQSLVPCWLLCLSVCLSTHLQCSCACCLVLLCSLCCWFVPPLFSVCLMLPAFGICFFDVGFWVSHWTPARESCVPAFRFSFEPWPYLA